MDSDKVTLTVPARDEFARTVRMTAAALLGRADVSVDVIEDVRIAVDEAFIHACGSVGSGGRIGFDFRLHDDRLDVRIGPLESVPDPAESDSSNEYARFILESICDEFEACPEESGVFLCLTKRLGDE